ncbi:MAG: alpha/beta hydrolase [Actinocatenispora sp.]
MATADTRGVTAADGTLLHVAVDGAKDAGRTIVLAHGWSLSHRSWDPVVRALRLFEPPERLRIVAYDQRHHGGSARGDSELDLDLLGDDLHRVLDAVVPTGAFVLGGHSMGGMTIMALAARYPELIASRVSGVALVSTSAGGPSPRPNPTLRWLTGPALDFALRHHTAVERLRRLSSPAMPVHRRAAARMLFGATTAPEVVRAGTELIAATPMRTVLEFWPALESHDKTASLEPLGAVPVEIVVGSQDRLTPPRRARYLAERIDGARLTELPGHGHMLTLESPELLARTLLSLAGVPSPTPAR